MKIIKIILASVFVFASLLLVGCGNDKHVHEWTNGVITKKPTVTEYGEMRFSCKFCDETLEKKIEKLPHEHNHSSEWKYNEIKHWHPCTIEGCTVASESQAHNWDDGEILVESTQNSIGMKKYTCTVCSATKESAYNASFKIDSEQLDLAISQGAFTSVSVEYKKGEEELTFVISNGTVKYTENGENKEIADTAECKYGSYAIAEALSCVKGQFDALTYQESTSTYVYSKDGVRLGLQFADGRLVFASIITDESVTIFRFTRV